MNSYGDSHEDSHPHRHHAHDKYVSFSGGTYRAKVAYLEVLFALKFIYLKPISRCRWVSQGT